MRIRKSLAIAVLVSRSANAQETTTKADKHRYLDQQLEESRGTRRLGLALTVGGALGVVAGGTFFGVAEVNAVAYHLDRAASYRTVGIACLAAGVAAAGIGVVFWVQGALRVDGYEKKRDELMLTVVPLGEGGALLASWW